MNEEPTTAAGNDTLGIARFATTDSGSLTRIVGFDEAGVEVARVDLTHGRFQIDPRYADDYAPGTTQTIGRRLTASIAPTVAPGQELAWETAGFEPTLHMPAHPTSQWAIAALLEAPHVKPLLAEWKIGFESTAGTMGEDRSYTIGAYTEYGTNVWNCSGQSTCGYANGSQTINMCNGGSSGTLDAFRLDQQVSGYGTEIRVMQCCSAGSGFSTPWFGIKTCNPNGATSSCGTTTGACKGCVSYGTNQYCFMTGDSSSAYYEWENI